MKTPTDHPTRRIRVDVNGSALVREVECRKHLVDFLREDCGLNGSHLGCEHGVCGACTVRLDGEIVRGCLMLAVQADGRRVETIETPTPAPRLKALQDAFVERNALQCGYCTPGMLMAALELVERPARRRPRARCATGSAATTAAAPATTRSSTRSATCSTSSAPGASPGAAA